MSELSQIYHYYFQPVAAPWWQGAIYGNLLASALIGITGFYAVYRKLECSKPGCYRIGHHQVKGTHYKTCHKHTTQEHHDKLFSKHAAKHPEAHEFLNGTKITFL